MKLTLVSFNLCPFVQRAAMVLELAKKDYDIKFIDLSNPPQWFLDISPLGKVPLLIVEQNNEETILFESQVIADWLADKSELNLYSTDSLVKAHQRGWCEFASDLLGTHYQFSMTTDADVYTKNLEVLKARLTFIESYVQGPYFAGDQLTMPDIAFTTFFWRQQFFEKHAHMNLYAHVPKIKSWAQALINLPESKKAVIDDYEKVLLDDNRRQSSYLFSQF